MIKTFVGFVERQIEVISALSFTPSQAKGVAGKDNIYLYKKIAYVCLLDYFASLRFHKSAYPQLSRQNNKRFTRFLEECAAWDVGRLVSLPFLSDRLPKASVGGKLAQFLSDKLSSLGNNFGDTVSAKDIDEQPETLLKLSSLEKEEEAIDFCQHYSILYRYRNNLVHQARRPGGASELMGEGLNQACYQTYAHDQSIYLLYPVGLFKELCTSSLRSLRSYLEGNNLDPFEMEDDPRCF